MASVEFKSEGSGASLLKKKWSQVRYLIREEREAFRAEREQTDAALRVEQSEAAAAQERLRAETENLRASMEQLQWRVEGRSIFARGERFACLRPVEGLEGQLPARLAAGSGFVPAEFQSLRSSVSGDSGTASAPRIDENMAFSNLTKQTKDVSFFHGAKPEFPKFKRHLITLAKQHGLFRVFTEDVEIPVDEEKSDEEIQATGFAEDEVRKRFLAWNILSRTIKGKKDNDILRRVTSPTAAWRILVGLYSATTRDAKLRRMKALTNRRVKPGSNPIHILSEMVDDARDFRVNGTTDISDEIVCVMFLRVLPEE